MREFGAPPRSRTLMTKVQTWRNSRYTSGALEIGAQWWNRTTDTDLPSPYFATKLRVLWSTMKESDLHDRFTKAA
jgi:hypothetical protein